jgi:uncharacterized membrane protein affecting hemolysin expression
MARLLAGLTDEENGQSTRRLVLILASLPLVTAIVVYSSLFSYQQIGITAAAEQYGKSTARLIAQQVARHVVEQDVLSLTVITTKLTKNEPVLSVSIYNDSDQLLVQSRKAQSKISQSGQGSSSQDSFTAEITFQDSVVGFVRISAASIEQSLALPLTALAILYVLWVGLTLSTAGPALNFILGIKNSRVKHKGEGDDPEATATDSDYVEEALLIVRIKPARTLTRYFNRFFRAAKLYGGIVEQTTPEELVIHFEGPDAIFLSVCAGLLLQKIAHQTQGKVGYGAVLTSADDSDKNRKSASYLASISEGDLLFSEKDILLDERIIVSSFHHSLVNSNDLLRVSGLQNQKLLDAQVNQLMAESV